jgi:hypothetical protein
MENGARDGRLAANMSMTSIVPHNAAHQRHGKVARILRFAECVTL